MIVICRLFIMILICSSFKQ